MNVRARLIGCSLALTTPFAAYAQTAYPSVQAEADVQAAYSTLGANTGIRFDIAGTQTDYASGGRQKVTPIGGELYYRAATNLANGLPTINVDLYQTVNGVETFELIADGQTVWTYRPALQATSTYAGTYSALSYAAAGSGTSQIQSYAQQLVTALSMGSPAGGPASYAVRLVRELFGNPALGPTYHSWIPMAPAFGPVEIAVPTVYQDPITGLYANPTTGLEQTSQPTTLPETWWVVYNEAPKRAIAFELLSAANNGPNSINRVYYSDRQTFGSTTRITQWTITPVITTDFTSANFSAYPPSRMRYWRPVIGPRT